ncbi:MAG: FAD-dependent oxidoreductase [Myxococcota bacterium]
MNRRTLLQHASWAAVAAACAHPVPPSPPRATLPRVHVSRDRIIDITVGLRPFRPAGPRVEAQQFGDTTVVHHYGHGGAGMSLAWGTARRAADLAVPKGEIQPSIAVLGAGVVGLCTARQLQRRGARVTIYTKAVSPYTTSHQSLATWSPGSNVVRHALRSPAFDEAFATDAQDAYLELQRLVGRDYGVSWVDTYVLRKQPWDRRFRSSRLYPSLPVQRLEAHEHPFVTHQHVGLRPSLRMEPAIYLDALLRDVLAAGGRLVLREFESRDHILNLPVRTVVNCLGRSGGQWFDDDSVIPIQGQLLRLVPQPEITYGLSSIETDQGDFFYMTPRADGIVLGGSSVRNEASLDPNDAITQAIVDVHASVMAF